MVIYVPGTEETDPKKQNMSLQAIAASATTTAATTATNTAAIAALAAASFPSGTLMLFQQTSAPTGWTKQTTHNDKALRVVSGSASSGGTNAFSTVMAQTSVGGTALSIAQLPAHTHNIYNDSTFAASAVVASSPSTRMEVNSSLGTVSGSSGSGSTHNHTITMAVQYVDLIIASKD